MKQLTLPRGLLVRRQRTHFSPDNCHGMQHSKTSPIVRAAGILALGFIMAIALARLVIVAVSPEGFISALADYQSIQPGIPLEAIRPLACGPRYFVYEVREEKCDLTQVGAKLRRVTLTLQNGKVSKVSFVGNGLQAADLIAIWGRPDSISSENGTFTLRWEAGIRAIATGRHQFTFHLSVKVVVFS